MIKHLDLFSGIGGFALAAQRVWGKDHEVMGFCEIDIYCQQVLKKHWPKVRIYGDIRSLTSNSYCCGFIHGEPKEQSAEKSLQAQRKSVASVKSSVLCDLITGGFPCQPFSKAGRRKGADDDRYLWPEMFRVITEFRPRWVVGENVAGITSIFKYECNSPLEGKEYSSKEEAEACFEGISEREGKNILLLVVEQLEKIGYDVQPVIIPACAVNAPHRRDRVWIIAHRRDGAARSGLRQVKASAIGRKRFDHDYRITSYGNSSRFQGGAVPEIYRGGSVKTGEASGYNNRRTGWEQDWLEVATRLCGVDDGLPARVDGFELSKSKHREARIKSLGNAIVPQVAEQIFRSIKEIDILCGSG